MSGGFGIHKSGKLKEFSSGMLRDASEGKPRFDLLIPKDVHGGKPMLVRWAEHLTRACSGLDAKYAARNWEKASTQEEQDRFLASAFRHLVQLIQGDRSEDHAAAVFFNVNGAEYVRDVLEDGISSKFPPLNNARRPCDVRGCLSMVLEGVRVCNGHNYDA